MVVFICFHDIEALHARGWSQVKRQPPQEHRGERTQAPVGPGWVCGAVLVRQEVRETTCEPRL